MKKKKEKKITLKLDEKEAELLKWLLSIDLDKAGFEHGEIKVFQSINKRIDMKDFS